MKRKLFSSFGRLAAVVTVLAVMPLTARADVAIDEQTFPDPNFRKWLLQQKYGKDGLLTDDEIKGVKTIDVSRMGIETLEGIKIFVALKSLGCSGNQLTALDVSGCTALQSLICQNNDQLTALDVSGCTALIGLYCQWNNNLTAIDVSGCKALEDVRCFYTKLTSLDVSGCTALTTLDCQDNQMTTLDASGCTALNLLWCYNNQLTSLDVSGCTALETLDCQNNQLTSLDVSGCTTLFSLRCYNNQLTALDVSSNMALQDLYCNGNQLTTLDVSANTELQVLYCYGNQISGEAMDALIASLRDRTEESYAGQFAVYSEVGETGVAPDGNVCTKEQVAQAKERNWDVYYAYPKYIDDVNWFYVSALYEGADPESVSSLQADGLSDAPVYDLSGRRLHGQPRQKGIYLRNGKKILYK